MPIKFDMVSQRNNDRQVRIRFERTTYKILHAATQDIQQKRKRIGLQFKQDKKSNSDGFTGELTFNSGVTSTGRSAGLKLEDECKIS